jgi:hypothetical protein
MVGLPTCSRIGEIILFSRSELSSTLIKDNNRLFCNSFEFVPTRPVLSKRVVIRFLFVLVQSDVCFCFFYDLSVPGVPG